MRTSFFQGEKLIQNTNISTSGIDLFQRVTVAVIEIQKKRFSFSSFWGISHSWRDQLSFSVVRSQSPY